MPDEDRPQIYLVTPPDFSLVGFPDLLASVLDTIPVACLRLKMASLDEITVSKAADALREVAHARDVPLVIESHLHLVELLGLDGVHLTDGPKTARATRKALGPDAIIGAFCGASRHDGISTAEAGADYVSFGPIGQTVLGSGEVASPEIFAWWSEMIELPVVAEGALDEALIHSLAPTTDFFALGEEIWSTENPIQTLKSLIKAMD